MSLALPLRHVLLALAIVALWGSNFAVIGYALNHLPPLLFAVLRFTMVLLPAAFFLPWPKVHWSNAAMYGLFIGAGQFALLYTAVNGHISPGLASLVVQVQVFFTVGLAMALAGESLRFPQVVALLLAASGIGVIIVFTDGATTPLGITLVLGAALSWSLGNIVNKKAGPVNMLAYVVWSSVFAVPVLLALSLIFEGPAAIETALRSAGIEVWGSVLFQSWGNTLFGYTVWGWLLARYPAAAVAPMALLVPVFGMTASALALGEGMPAWKILAAALVIGGLALNLFWPTVLRTLRLLRASV